MPVIAETLFDRGGVMAGRMAALDWAATSLGSPDTWPQSLRAAVRIMLTSRYAMWMAWGPELIFFYNDAYTPTLGVKQPWALGCPAQKVWEEIWPDIGPRIDHVLKTGEATWDEGLLLFLQRSGYTEESYHTFSYSPLSDDSGNVAGMLCVVTEETERVVGERRMAVLRDLARELAGTSTEADVFAATERCLGRARYDFPFALAYCCTGQQARLVVCSGAVSGSAVAPQALDCQTSSPLWPLGRVLNPRETVVLDDLPPLEKLLPGPWPRPPQRAMLLPLSQTGRESPVGVLIVGINPFRPLDAAFRSFASLFAGQLTASISNAHAYEAERRRAEALAEIDRAKTTFFSNVSHEFRTPLTLMLGPLMDTLSQQNGPLPPRVSQELSVVHRNGLRLLKLVNTLLDFSRIEAGRVQASFVPTDLAALTTDLASTFRSAIDKAGLTLTVDTPTLPEPAYVDRDMWEKIVLNLLSNAFKFTLEGEITVRLREVDKQIQFSVIDTGSGVPPAELPRLFERFHRVEGTRGRTHEGSGIGLALVQELVRIHGGQVSVESELGAGSMFTVSIPVGKNHLPADRIYGTQTLASTAVGYNAFVEEALRWLPDQGRFDQMPTDQVAGGDQSGASMGLDEPASRSPAQRDDQAASTRPRVLIADDNADMRDYVRRLLSDRYNVSVAGDGKEALLMVQQQPPALILSDVMMPEMDGFALLRAVRDDPALKGVPVVLLSARAGEEATLDGIRAGADDYLIKPFSARELLARVEAQIERKKFERQLAATEQRLQTALIAAKMVAWDWDPETNKATTSVNAAEVFGLNPGVVLNSSDIGFATVHPEDRQRHEALVRNAAAAGTAYHTEFRIIRPVDGKLAWLEERASAVVDPTTGKSRMVGLTSDVTERKLAEAALQRSEARARFMVQLDDVLRTIIDPDEMSHTAARFLARRFNCDRALYAEVDADEDHCRVTGEYSNGLPSIKGEYRISEYGAEYIAAVRANRPYIENDTQRDGLSETEQKQFAALNIGAFVSAPLFKGGKLVAMFIVHDCGKRIWQDHEVEEVSLVASRCWESIERARVARELATSEERLAFAVEAADLGTFYCPMPMGDIIWNDKCKEYFWLDPEARVTFEIFYARIHEEDRERTRQAVDRTVYHREPYDIEYRTVAPDGRWRWIRAKGRAYHDSAGNPTRFDGVALDITEMKLNEQRREATLLAERNARTEAERVSRMKDEFLATLSHELRTPLNAILGWSQILIRSGEVSEEIHEGLEAIERNARSQTQMIEDLLDMSRIISGKIRLDVQRLVIADVVQAAVQSVRPSAEVKGVRLLTVLDPHAGPVAGDANRLQQVVWNLLTNAIKFTPRGGQVQVLLERVNSHLELSVSDTGEGIAPEFLPHVFERFRQADASTTRKHGGLGLGLNIVKQLVELHGGAVRAKSPGVGKGSVFSIDLPLAIAEFGESHGEAGRKHPRNAVGQGSLLDTPSLSGVTVLVVDDDADARSVMRRILSEGGASVVTASSVAEAVSVLPQLRPSLIVSDIGMPMEDGYDLIRRVRSMKPDEGGNIPAVALTAFARSEDRQRALRAGYQIHVAKPVEPSELITVCASLAGKLGAVANDE
jgi:PAS domain S-box-containing protein